MPDRWCDPPYDGWMTRAVDSALRAVHTNTHDPDRSADCAQDAARSTMQAHPPSFFADQARKTLATPNPTPQAVDAEAQTQLRRYVTRAAINRMKRPGARSPGPWPGFDEGAEPPAPRNEDDADRILVLGDLRRCMEKLQAANPTHWSILTLCFVEGKTLQQIADHLTLPLANVFRQRERAQTFLATCVGGATPAAPAVTQPRPHA